MTACRKQRWRINFILWFYYFCFSVGEILGILNRESLQKGYGWVYKPQNNTLNLHQARSELGANRNTGAPCSAQPNTGWETGVQNSLSAISRVWEASEQGLGTGKGPLLLASPFSAAWCLPTNPISGCVLSPERRLGTARGSQPRSNRCSASSLNWVWSPVKYLQK